MPYLLDTHTFLWFASDDVNLSKTAKNIIEDFENDIYLSSASVWELIIKIWLGKLKLKKDAGQFIAENIVQYGFIPLSINIPHAIEVSKLPEIHRDPFDRILIAQSVVENIGIITSDKFINKYDVKTIW